MKTPQHMARLLTGQPTGTADGVVDARLTAALVLATFGLSCGLRLLCGSQGLAGRSGQDAMAFLTTQDSYAWLAGAEKVNQYSGSLLAVIVRCLQAMTGFDSAGIGFWLPAVIAPLVVIPVCLLAAWWRLPEAAPVAATLAGASFGFLTRTGIGAFDTDVLTLFFPVSMALCLIIWLEPLMRPPWGRVPAPDKRKMYLQALGTGLLFRAYLEYYPSGQAVGLAVLGCAALPALLAAGRGLRYDMAASLALVLIAGAGSRYGLLAAVAVAVLAAYAPGLFLSGKTRLFIGMLLAAAFFFALDSSGILHGLLFDLSRYGRFAPRPAGVMLPSTIQTVQEAQAITLPVAMQYIAGNWFLFIAGLCGFVYCAWRRPAALVFAPLLVLGLASTMLGSRFSMYGGAAVGVGLGFGSALALRSRGLKSAVRWLVQLALLGMILWTVEQQAVSAKPETILRKEYTEALQALRERAAPDAQLWVWWDAGYAAQYYSRRMTFADGSRNTGEYTIPLARVFNTSSPLYACRLMTFTACRQKAEGELKRRSAAVPVYPNPFLQLLHEIPPARAQELLQSNESMALDDCGSMPEQYLVVSWDTVKIAKTISGLATWNLVSGSSLAGRIFPVAGNIEFDMSRGAVTVDGAAHAARGMAILTDKGAERYSWPGNITNPFVVGNLSTRELFAVDSGIFTSLMVQMLAAEPKTFEPWFTLVIDRLPHARVYRLNPGAAFTATNLRP